MKTLATQDPRFRADGVVREVMVGAVPFEVNLKYEAGRVNLNTAPVPAMRTLITAVGRHAGPSHSPAMEGCELFRDPGCFGRLPHAGTARELLSRTE